MPAHPKYGFYTFNAAARDQTTASRVSTQTLWTQYQAGVKVPEIAARHGVSTGTVYTRLKKAGHFVNGSSAGVPRKRSETLAMWIDHQAGMEISELAVKYNCSASTIYDRFKLMGLQHRRSSDKSKALTEKMWAEYETGARIPDIAARYSCSVHSVYSRFHSAGLPMKATKTKARYEEAVDMYFDYAIGLSVEGVAAKWGVTERQVRNRFRTLGVPLRKKGHKGNLNQYRNPTAIIEIHRARARVVGAQMAEVAKTALQTETNPKVRRILQARVDNPEMTLSELGQLCGASKDTVSGVLRRAKTKLMETETLETAE